MTGLGIIFSALSVGFVIALVAKLASSKPSVRPVVQVEHLIRAEVEFTMSPLRVEYPEMSAERLNYYAESEAERLRAEPFVQSEEMEYHFGLAAIMATAPASKQKELALAMVARSAEVVPMWRMAYPGQPLPGHDGFRRLTIDAEKAGDFAEAITWCERAKSEEWAGDWDKRIERCSTKANRRAALKTKRIAPPNNSDTTN